MPKSAVKSKPAPKKAKKLAPVPEGVAWVSAYLSVKSPESAIEFYQKAFGFEKKMAVPGPDGKIGHAELAYKDNTIMLGPEFPPRACFSPNTLKGQTATLYVYTENVDKLTERARKAGATIVQEPKDEFWGDRVSCIADPEGHKWAFATRFKEFDPSDVPGGCCE